jgi:hypothetical protein
MYSYDADGIRMSKYTYSEALKETNSLSENEIRNIVNAKSNKQPLGRLRRI